MEEGIVDAARLAASIPGRCGPTSTASSEHRDDVALDRVHRHRRVPLLTRPAGRCPRSCADYEHWPGVGGQLGASSAPPGTTRRPAGLVIESYSAPDRRRVATNRHDQEHRRPERGWSAPRQPHFFLYRDGVRGRRDRSRRLEDLRSHEAVNFDRLRGQPLLGRSRSRNSGDKLASRRRTTRIPGAGDRAGAPRAARSQPSTRCEDRTILRYLPALREALRSAADNRGITKAYLSICAIYQDEAPYLREWIEFHRLVGVERFFLYDNDSVDDHREVLAPYIEEGIVVLHDWPVVPGQVQAVRRLPRAAPRRLALDRVPRPRRVPLLAHRQAAAGGAADYEQWPGVVVNWAIFGTSGHRRGRRDW